MNEVHPACLPIDELLAQCDVRHERRSGPGGQHRNKVATAVVLTHRPTGVRAEANERRSQAENHAEAVRRLRLRWRSRFVHRQGLKTSTSGGRGSRADDWRSIRRTMIFRRCWPRRSTPSRPPISTCGPRSRTRRHHDAIQFGSSSANRSRGRVSMQGVAGAA